MTRPEAVSLMLAVFSVGMTALGWYVNRRVAAWVGMLNRLGVIESRLSKVEERIGLVDVGGTHGNREAIAGLRRDLEALESAIARASAEADHKLASTQLSIATLAERLNGWVYRTAGDRERGDRPSGHT